MHPRRFVQNRPFLALAVVLAAWLLAPAALLRLGRASFFEFQAPLDVAASRARDLQQFWSLNSRPKADLIEAGRDLARLNASYEVRNTEAARLRDEVARLETLLNLPSFPTHRSEPARVARRDFNGWWQRMVIRKGKAHGIVPGSPVIFVGGVAGKVTEVGAYTSVVELVSSPGLRLAASFEGDSRPVSYQGGLNPTLGPAQGVVEFVPLDVFASAQSPKRLVTSGLGGIFPPGLTVGFATRIEPSTDGLFKTGSVRLDPRLAEISEVTVLVPLESP